MSRKESACSAVETLLTSYNFMDAQKRFDAQYNENEKALLTKRFLEHLLHNIRQCKEAISNREYHKETIGQELKICPKDEYQEKLFSLDDKVTTLIIENNEQEFTAYDSLYKEVKTDGSNICYCVWLYNKGEFRTEEEKNMAKALEMFKITKSESKYLETRKCATILGVFIAISPLILLLFGYAFDIHPFLIFGSKFIFTPPLFLITILLGFLLRKLIMVFYIRSMPPAFQPIMEAYERNADFKTGIVTLGVLGTTTFALSRVSKSNSSKNN